MQSAERDLGEFWSVNGWNHACLSSNNPCLCPQDRWRPPDGDTIKINVDGSLTESGFAGIGIVLRDNQCKLLDCFAFKVHSSSAFMSEALALRKGVQIAKSLDLVDCSFESDCSLLVNAVNGSCSSVDWRFSPILEDIISITRTIRASLMLGP